jgi:tRNA U34 2-thiouridine synthase MnmA/TrmU
MLSAAQLDHVLLPIGGSTKGEVRRGGRPACVLTKPDSQDVCFITMRDGRERFCVSASELPRESSTPRAPRSDRSTPSSW